MLLVLVGLKLQKPAKNKSGMRLIMASAQNADYSSHSARPETKSEVVYYSSVVQETCSTGPLGRNPYLGFSYTYLT